MVEVLNFNDIEVLLTFKPIKNVHLRVHPPLGNITLSAPLGMDKEHLRVYVSTKLGWIRREKKKITAQEREPEHHFITMESHYFFGKRYLLQITESVDNAPNVILHHGKIELIVPPGSPVEYRKDKLYQWYRKQLRSLLKEIIEQYSKTMSVKPLNFGIRKVRTKWGSCNDKAQSIWFNIELAKKPKECIEYIVVHELVHLKERKHNKNFVMLMSRYLPNWQSRKKLLNLLPISN